ncbi:MAG: hypothetical protein CMI02_00300 [Oceanospirillaceae bacterium]|nr:hypothetical protein [Oceanospirillaceae bacterium]MBT10458.1 hypothetical protein [Oceanospirillaceae bacterium]
MTSRLSCSCILRLMLLLLVSLMPAAMASQSAPAAPGSISNLSYLASDQRLSKEAAEQTTGWTPVDGYSANFGFDRRWFWFRFDLPPQESAHSRILQLQYPLLDQVTLYLYRGDQLLHTETLGFSLPFNARTVADTRLAFTLPAGLDADRAMLEVQSNSSLQVSLRLYADDEYWKIRSTEIAADSAFHAILWAMLAYNLLLFLLTRHPSFVLYCLSIAATSFMMANLHGWTFRLFWPQTPALNDFAVIAGVTATEVFSSLFGIYILRMKRLAPGLYRIFLAFIAAALVSGLSGLILPYSLVAQFQTALGAVMTIVALAGGLRLARSRDVMLYFIALFSLLCGMLVLALKNFGLLPVNLFTSYAAEAGYVLQVIFFALSIGDRQLRERHARIAAQDVLIALQRETNEALENKVRERTADLQLANLRLQQESTTDALTQVRNRRCFDQTMDTRCQEADRQNTPLSLLLIDIDHFKQVNDQWGHGCGDIVLQKVASLLDHALSQRGEHLYRYGGEEFAVILSGYRTAAAQEVAEALRRQVADLRVPVSGTQLKVTISIGVASRQSGAASDCSRLCEQADQALYRAKDNGRDNISA